MSDDPREGDRNAGTFAALGALVLAGLLFLGLISLVMPDAFKLVFVAALFIGSFVLQYLVWGRWLTRVLKDAEDAKHVDPPPSQPTDQ